MRGLRTLYCLFIPIILLIGSGPVSVDVYEATGPDAPCSLQGPTQLGVGVEAIYIAACGECKEEKSGSLFSCSETKRYRPAYIYDWGDGEPERGDASRSHAWTLPGTYEVRVRGACKDEMSEWSNALVVVVQETAVCEVTPASLDFANVCVGDTETGTFQVKWPATAVSNLTGHISLSAAGFSLVAGGGSFSLAPGGIREVTVAFTPTSSSFFTATIGTGSVCGDVTCVGTGIECAACQINPTSLNFTETCVGETATRDLQITWPASAVTALSGEISLDSEVFAVVEGHGEFSLAPGGTHHVTVSFSPTAVANYTAAISTGSVCGDVPCAGSGVECVQCVTTPAALAFGDVCVGSELLQEFRVTSQVSIGSIDVNVISNSDHFVIVSGGGPQSIAPNDHLDVAVEFRPSAVGATAGVISLGGACAGVSVPATGSGAVGQETLLSWVGGAPWTVGNVCVGETEDRVLTVNCAPTEPCGVSGTVTITGDSAGCFSLVGATSYALSPGQSQGVTLRYQAAASPGQHTCTLQAGAATAGVTATSLGGTSTLSTTSLDFSQVCVAASATREFSLINSTPCSDEVNVSLSSTPHFTIVSGGGTHIVPAGSSHTVTVAFQPTAIGSQTATVSTNRGAVNLAGSGAVGHETLASWAGGTPWTVGNVCVGETEDRVLTVNCAPTEPCGVSGTVTITGDSAGCFSLVGATSYVLSPGQSQEITLRYQAAASPGQHTCTLQAGAATAGVTATSLGGTSTLSTTSLNFGLGCVGEGQKNLSFSLVNSHACSDQVTVSLSSSPHFSIVSGGGTHVVPGGTSHVVTVAFHPTALGTQTATVTTNRGNVTLEGSGSEQTGCAVDPTTPIAFSVWEGGVSSPVSRTITVAGPCSVTGHLYCTNGDLSFPVGGGAFTIQPGGGHVFQAQFTPSFPGVYSGHIWTQTEDCAAIPWSATVSSSVPYICFGFAPDSGALDLGQFIYSSNFWTAGTIGSNNLEVWSYRWGPQFASPICGGPWFYPRSGVPYSDRLRLTSTEGAAAAACTIQIPGSARSNRLRFRFSAGEPASGVGASRVVVYLLQYSSPAPNTATAVVTYVDPECGDYDRTINWPSPTHGGSWNTGPITLSFRLDNDGTNTSSIELGAHTVYGYFLRVDFVN